MFLGRFDHTIDAKGRLAIPSRFRDELVAGAVLTRGIDRCLTLYPLSAWSPLAEKVSALSISDPLARNFRRFVFAAAVNLELDTQGRILVPSELREYAGIERDVAVVGVNTCIELWSLDRWSAANAELDQQGGGFAERLASLI
jgi:MraZ protein